MTKRIIAVALALVMAGQVWGNAGQSAAFRREINPEVAQRWQEPIKKPAEISTGKKVLFFTMLIVGVASFVGVCVHYRRTATASNF